jgi:5,10-methylenetetrahydromethanopterin reductase
VVQIKFGIELSPERPCYEIAFHSKIAEDAGFCHVWITDHYNNRNVWVTLADIARNTRTIFLGSAVTNPYVCNPVWSASALFTIDEMSGGRAVFGIGAGDRLTLNAMGMDWDRPLCAIREAVGIFRELAENGKVKYKGQMFQVPKAKLKIKPRKNIAVYMGAQGPKMLALASHIADGVLINFSHPEDFKPAIAILREGVVHAGRNLDEVDIAAYTSFSIDEKREKAIRKARIVAGAIAAGCPDYVNERHNITKEEAGRMRELFSAQRFDEMKEGGVPDHIVEAYSIAGTPRECVEKIFRLSDMGVNQIVCGMPLGKSKVDAIKLIRENVIPCFT